MLIEVEDGPPFDCLATVTVGDVRYKAGPTYWADLRDDVLAFASGLAAGRPFAPQFGDEPLFNVDFEDDRFVAYTYRPRFRPEWLWWLGGVKVTSTPESVTEAAAYLTQFAANLERF